MHKISLISTLVICLAIAPAWAADGFPNPGFENASKDGWTVGGRKDANAKVISTKPFFDSLSHDRDFRNSGGWENHPLAIALDRQNNKFILRISSSGYITATTQSSVKIESGKQYAVSLIVRSGNGGPAVYYLDVYGVGDDGLYWDRRRGAR